MSLTSYRAAPPRVIFSSYRALRYLRTVYFNVLFFGSVMCVLMFVFFFRGQEGLAATYSPVP
jgi:hypothetical protein